MITKLDKPLRREVDIDGAAYVVTLSPEGLRVVVKGRRKGLDVRWSELVSGDAALAAALQASMGRALEVARKKQGDRESRGRR